MWVFSIRERATASEGTSIRSAMLSATACNTVKGAGEDIKSVGQAGERAIKK